MTAPDALPLPEASPGVWVVGAGIAGLALAHAWGHYPELHDWPLTLIEQTAELTEVGAGVQLGPNATRILQRWGLEPALRAFVVQPQSIRAHNARGERVGELPLGSACESRYGAPYWTIHRGDLHGCLLRAVREAGRVALHTNRVVQSVATAPQGVPVLQIAQADGSSRRLMAQAVIAADGVWSSVRRTHWPQSVWRDSGQVAYRAVVPMSLVPKAWQGERVNLWMMPHLHVVAYPMASGQSLNLVVLLDRQGQLVHQSWDQRPTGDEVGHDFECATRHAPADLKALLASAPDWRVWPLVDSSPLQSAADLASGCVALMGDAGHPMLPYMAQGAGMAIEDAQTLAQLASQQVQRGGLDVVRWFNDYAQARWQRCARVQAKALRNGYWFHAQGLQASLRDLGLRCAAERIMDVPWLYGEPKVQGDRAASQR